MSCELKIGGQPVSQWSARMHVLFGESISFEMFNAFTTLLALRFVGLAFEQLMLLTSLQLRTTPRRIIESGQIHLNSPSISNFSDAIHSCGRSGRIFLDILLSLRSK